MNSGRLDSLAPIVSSRDKTIGQITGRFRRISDVLSARALAATFDRLRRSAKSALCRESAQGFQSEVIRYSSPLEVGKKQALGVWCSA